MSYRAKQRVFRCEVEISPGRVHCEEQMSTRDYFVYILTNNSNDVLYVGVTNNLGRRLVEHKQHLVEGFTDEYNVTKLVYYERSGSVTDAIAREKQLKGWTRKKKFQLINSVNSELKDLSEEYSLLFEKD